MAELENLFSWSHSAAKDFEECRRRRYWDKYGKWGGWNRNASPVQRTAYRLSKISNRYQLMGDAVEKAVMWMLHENQAGRARTADEAFEAISRPLLRSKWDESTNGHWKANPKLCCLHEHYYPDFHAGQTDRDRIVQIGGLVKDCLRNFQDKFFPRFASIRFADEVEIASVQGGLPEFFELDGKRVYAIPDYVHRDGPIWHIHDWKAGKPRPEHIKQICVYALWAQIKHQIPAERVRLHLEYLQIGETQDVPVTEADLETVRDDIRAGISDMAEYLVDADTAANRPVPIEEWELAAEPSVCHRCNYYELCKPELDF
jgi:CRISPR/Cas system-associated exonuclease Cas4 (RecB family)